MSAAGERTCSACGQTKPLTEDHYGQYRRPWGLVWETRCRACKRRQDRARPRLRVVPSPVVHRQRDYVENFPELPRATEQEQDWKQHAECRGLTDWFERTPAECQEVCAQCPVQRECLVLAWTLARGNDVLGTRGLPGVWGGKTVTERKRSARGNLEGGGRHSGRNEAVQALAV